MTDRAEIETRVKKVLAEQLAVDEAQVVPDARFAEDLNADSLDLVEAVLALEEEWSIEIPEDEMEAVKTVGQAVDLVASKLGRRAAGRRRGRERAPTRRHHRASGRSRRSAPASTTFWTGLTSGRNGVRAITRFDTADLPVKVAGEVHDFDADRLPGRQGGAAHRPASPTTRSPRRRSRGTDAGEPEVVSERGGVIFATGIGGIQTLLKQHLVLLEKGPGRVSPFMVPMLMANAAAGHVAMRFGLTGPQHGARCRPAPRRTTRSARACA